MFLSVQKARLQFEGGCSSFMCQHKAEETVWGWRERSLVCVAGQKWSQPGVSRGGDLLDPSLISASIDIDSSIFCYVTPGGNLSLLSYTVSCHFPHFCFHIWHSIMWFSVSVPYETGHFRPILCDLKSICEGNLGKNKGSLPSALLSRAHLESLIWCLLSSYRLSFDQLPPACLQNANPHIGGFKRNKTCSKILFKTQMSLCRIVEKNSNGNLTLGLVQCSWILLTHRL